MNILYTINDSYVPQLASAITSVCENNKETPHINFYVIGDHISEKNQKSLYTYTSNYGRNLTIIELERVEDYFDFEFDTSGWNKIVLARLLVDKLLPSNLERVLYLDGDTTVIGRLEELWKINMTGYLVAGVEEPTVSKERKEYLGLKNGRYINAGVLLINLTLWRELNATKKILDYYKAHGGKLFANDQDAINGSLKGQIYYLPPKYNFCNTFYYYPYTVICKMISPVPYIDQNLFEESYNNPIIIHFLGEERPWREGNFHKYRKYYTKYLHMTPWKDTQFELGWKTYFFFLKVFNLITKPFPMLRYRVIQYLIPRFIEFRAKKLLKQR